MTHPLGFIGGWGGLPASGSTYSPRLPR